MDGLEAYRALENIGRKYELPDFDKIPDLIYPWPSDNDQRNSGSFLPLSNRLRALKTKMDAREKDFVGTAFLDEWENFVNPYEQDQDNSRFVDVVSRICITRAKRAFHASKTWTEFEKQELRAWTDEEELPKVVRLAIFDRLKVRLCEEIWLQTYPDPRDSKIPSPEVEERRRQPGHSARSSEAGLHPRSPRLTVESAASTPVHAQASSCTTRMVPDRFGMLQPLLGNETEPPSMDALQAAVRRDNLEMTNDAQRRLVSQQHIADQFKYATVGGISVGRRQIALPTFEMSMEQAQRDMESSDEEDFGSGAGN